VAGRVSTNKKGEWGKKERGNSKKKKKKKKKNKIAGRLPKKTSKNPKNKKEGGYGKGTTNPVGKGEGGLQKSNIDRSGEKRVARAAAGRAPPGERLRRTTIPEEASSMDEMHSPCGYGLLYRKKNARGFPGRGPASNTKHKKKGNQKRGNMNGRRVRVQVRRQVEETTTVAQKTRKLGSRVPMKWVLAWSGDGLKKFKHQGMRDV